MNNVPRQHFDPPLTPWHITFGTYGSRLHGGARPTVDKQHNQLNEQFISFDPDREEHERQQMRFPPLYFTFEQRLFVEAELPRICERGKWNYRIGAAGPDHAHLLRDVMPEVHGEKVRRLVKRWLGQEMSKRWPLPKDASWWTEEGSNKAIGDEDYLNNCYRYILEQRTSPPSQ
jgi:hypothetical protein